MKKIWKNIAAVAVIAAISSGAAIGTSTYLMNKNKEAYASVHPSYSFNQPYHQTNYQGSTTAGNLDFTQAAESTVNGVVHIKATTNPQAQESLPNTNPQYVNPFEYFFGFGGGGNGGNFQRPQPQPRVGSGSGVIISTDGYIITNNHVISGADELDVTLNDNRKFKAKLIGTDPTTDIALIKIEANSLPVIPFGDSEGLKIGEWVLAVGNPFNLTSTVTAGIVSAKSRGISAGGGGSKIESFIQTDAAVNPGNSGGALVNTKGELIGINTAIYSETGNFAGYSFAVPITIAGKVANDLKEFGSVQRGMLGVQIMSVGDLLDIINAQNIDAAYKKELEDLHAKVKVNEGVLVSGFAERSTSKEAGLEIGDVITAVNGVTVKSANALQEQISKYRPGDLLKVTVNRNGVQKDFDVELKNAQGSTSVVKTNMGVSEILGATFKALSDQQKKAYGVSYGIEVTNLTNGKLKNAGIGNNFVIMTVNNQKIASADQFEKIVEKIVKSNTEDRYILIKGFSPNGRTKTYLVDLSE